MLQVKHSECGRISFSSPVSPQNVIITHVTKIDSIKNTRQKTLFVNHLYSFTPNNGKKGYYNLIYSLEVISWNNEATRLELTKES